MMQFRPEQPNNQLPLLPPPREQIETIAILRQESRAATALAELKGLSRLLPNPTILINALVLKEAKASSEIENIVTTDDQLYRAMTLKGHTIDTATKEVLCYRQALYTGYGFIKDRGFLSTNGILQIQNEVIYTPPDDQVALSNLMRNLEEYLNTAEPDQVSPLIKLAVQHYQFESIHPFYDGNGRTGRIVNVLYLILQDLLIEPILYLSGYIIQHKADYYRLLQSVRTEQNWSDWILFMLRAVEETARQTIAQITAIQSLFDETLIQVRQKAPKVYSKELVEILFEYPYSKIDFLVERLAIERRTASKYLHTLESVGVLKAERKWKETLFINTGLFDLLRQ